MTDLYLFSFSALMKVWNQLKGQRKVRCRTINPSIEPILLLILNTLASFLFYFYICVKLLFSYLGANCNNKMFRKFTAIKAVGTLFHACSKLLVLTDCFSSLYFLLFPTACSLGCFGNKHVIQSVVLSVSFLHELKRYAEKLHIFIK